MGNYDIKRAFIAGATVRAEYPHIAVAQCIPRGEAGDVAYEMWWDATAETRNEDNVSAIPTDFDMVLFMLFLAEMVVDT